MGATEGQGPREVITHLVIARACDTDPDGPNAEARIGHIGEPPPEVLAEYTLQVGRMFAAGFDREAARIAVVVLPWATELDDREGA